MNGFWLLGIYFVIMMAITIVFARRNTDREEFLVGNRNAGVWSSALSIAATWIWAPALFVSAERAYLTGLPGLFWFLVPNVLCLVFFIPFAKRIRRQMPDGVTLSGYMDRVYSRRVKNVYLVQLGSIALLSTTVQLLAGGKILSSITGAPFWVMAFVLGLIAYSYSQLGGIRASIITDAAQMIIMIVVCVALVPWVMKVSGSTTLFQGLGGIEGSYWSLWDANGIEVFLGFGLVTAIGLAAGPFGDQSFWQRVFSVKEGGIGPAFRLGAASFALVPLSMGILGFMAAGAGFQTQDVSVVNLEFIAATLPAWVTWPFVFLLVSGLLSTVDSNLCAIASLSEDMAGRFDIRISKASMLVLIVAAAALANLPGMTILKLFLIYGVVRASSLLATILTLSGVRLDEAGVFYGVIASAAVGLPVFAYGTLLESNAFKVAGGLAAALLSGVVAMAVTRWKEYEARQKAIRGQPHLAGDPPKH